MTQRGNRRAQTFFEEGDYALYRDLLAQAAGKAGAEVWCYCLMPNHVHVIVVPSDEDELRRTFADTHRRYTGFINARHRWSGHLWQARFGAVAMDEDHLAAAVRHVSLNPVRARLAAQTQDWPWSSVAAHLAGDGPVSVTPVLERYGKFADFLGDTSDGSRAWRALRMSEASARPLGSAWMDALQERTGRTLKPQKRGPKPRELGVFSKLAPQY